MSDDLWLTVEDAAQRLGVTTRQVNRYGTDGRITTRRSKRRLLYLASDVEQLAEELGDARRYTPAKREPTAGDFLAAIKEQTEGQRQYNERIEQQMRQLAEGQEAIQKQLSTPQPKPSRWPTIVIIVLLVLLLVAVVYPLYLR